MANDRDWTDGDPELAADAEEARRQYRASKANTKGKPNGHDQTTCWGDPDLGVLQLQRRPPPALPIEAFGPVWGDWITAVAEAAACPPDYVAAPLLAVVSALIGNARWAQAGPGWSEPPFLWMCTIGDSGNGKSPGSDCLMRDVLPEIEHRMIPDFPDRLQRWRAGQEYDKAIEEKWKNEVRDAQTRGVPPPPPAKTAGVQPESPRLRQHDITIEKVATLLCQAAPKGLLITRDELAGWIEGMTNYNDAGRQFWLEAYGGRPYRVERQKLPEPIIVPRLGVAVSGGIQPDKLADLMKGPDDGLLARFLWLWPDAVPFEIGRNRPGTAWAIEALDKLRELDLLPGGQDNPTPQPIMVPLAEEAVPIISAFGREMQTRQAVAGGRMRSALGKARGHALRLSLGLEFLWWGAETGMTAPPTRISVDAILEAARLIRDYFVPMAERTYGDAACTDAERNASTLAAWIARERPEAVYVRHLQRKVRLAGLRTAAGIHAAAELLVDGDWLSPPPKATEFGPGRSRVAYAVNPALWRRLAGANIGASLKRDTS
jgi:hypothetical protein